MNNRITRKSTYTAILIVVFLTLILCSFLFAVVVSPIIQHYSLPKEFCSQEDIIYQMIESSYQDWIEKFRKGETIVLTFSTPLGETYIANASRWDIASEPPQFFVEIRDEIHEPFGYAGYVYGNPSMLDRRYKVDHVAGDLYCYVL